MEPTIHVGDHVVVSKLAYGVRVPFTTTWLTHGSGPARGDVVVLDLEEPGSPDVLLKRVVAVGGDWVEVRGGSVFIDGRPVADADVGYDSNLNDIVLSRRAIAQPGSTIEARYAPSCGR